MVLTKNVGYVFCQIFQLWRFRLACLWQSNPVPASQEVGFQQFRAIERFCVEGSNKRSDRGHSSNDLEFFTDCTFSVSERHFPIFANWLTLSVFLCNNGRGGLTSGLAWGLASVKSDPAGGSSIWYSFKTNRSHVCLMRNQLLCKAFDFQKCLLKTKRIVYAGYW